MQKKFSFILVTYIYMFPILNLLSPVINNIYARYGVLIALFIVAILLNRLYFNMKFIFVLVSISLFTLINALTVNHQSYVITDTIAIISYILLPLYLFVHKLVEHKYFINWWIKFSIIFTMLLPIFYLYKSMSYISYFDLASVSHLNILILTYCLFLRKSKKVGYILAIIINFVFLAIFGSRMILLASFICFFVGILFLKKSLKFYSIFGAFIAMGWIIYTNFLSILIYINSIIQSKGLSSRNLNLFIMQFSNKQSNSDAVLSGRDSIYPIVLNYLSENGLFPSGLGMTRVLTNESFYHSHNFFLEISLIFGFIFSFLLLNYFVVKFIKLLDSEFKYIIILLVISFLIRSTTGTYFIIDMPFMVIVSILIGYSRNSWRVT